jgi:hypothetical protein
MTLEAQTIARACGHNHLHHLEPEDLCALTMEAAAMAQVPLAGTDWYPGKPGGVLNDTQYMAITRGSGMAIRAASTSVSTPRGSCFQTGFISLQAGSASRTTPVSK